MGDSEALQFLAAEETRRPWQELLLRAESDPHAPRSWRAGTAEGEAATTLRRRAEVDLQQLAAAIAAGQPDGYAACAPSDVDRGCVRLRVGDLELGQRPPVDRA